MIRSQHDDKKILLFRRPQEYRSEMKVCGKGMKGFGDCCTSDEAAVREEVFDGEPYKRHALRQAEQGVQ